MKPIQVNNVDIHVTNRCNLKCRGCNHLANFNYKGMFNAEELVGWIAPWKDRLFFKRISLMGGEPLLNPDLQKICIAYRDLFPPETTKLRIITNGILVKKCPWLEELIQAYGVHVQVSLHVFAGRTENTGLIDDVKEGLELLKGWSSGVSQPQPSQWAPPLGTKAKLNFQVFYREEGGRIKPFQQDEIEESKKHCTCKTLQLYQRNLYKCAPIAYIKEIAKKTGMSEDPAWQPYLNYEPLQPGCSDEQLADFMRRQPLPEWTCRMCPTHPNVILSDRREILFNTPGS